MNTELDDYLKVTREDLKRAANKYFVPHRASDILHYPVPDAPSTTQAGAIAKRLA